MKLKLEKIEATLHQLKAKSAKDGEQPSLNSGERTNSPSVTSSWVQAKPSAAQVNPFPAKPGEVKRTPALPQIKQPGFTSHRNGVNPYLAMNLLKEMETVVERWQTELRQILRQIQDIYMEGPIVEGWLESESSEMPTPTAVEISSPNRENKALSKRSPAPNNPTSSGYRLCGWDELGRIWSRPCPAQDLASVSLAIARYQKLQSLLVRKQELENNLTQLAEVLVVVQGHIQNLD